MDAWLTITSSVARPRRVAAAVAVDGVPARDVLVGERGQRHVVARAVGVRPQLHRRRRDGREHDDEEAGEADARVDARGGDVLELLVPLGVAALQPDLVYTQTWKVGCEVRGIIT